jgi:hypothetical protein
MTSAQPARPWDKYRDAPSVPGSGPLHWKLVQPGWGGTLTEEEVQFIQQNLHCDAALAFAWGFRPGQTTRSEAAIRRVAMFGDPDSRATNIKLARSRSDKPPIVDDKVA